jgi:hypothetical protein
MSAKESGPATWFLARRLFLAGIAACYGVAFVSLAPQLSGLFGSEGIAPVADLMENAREQLDWSERWRLPTLFWFGASDTTLRSACVGGIVLAALAAFGILPRVALGALWVLYLSFASAGSPFLDFQWDALLLEAGFLAFLLAPGGLRPFGREEHAPPSILLWLVRWLLVRLMLLSGVVKLTSGDDCWWDCSALAYHYWTQPLPHRLSHHVHHLPDWFQRFSVLVMFAIELLAPLLVFGPRRLKQAAAGAVVLLMALISATGNYGFFNLLTVVLCIPLVDDRAWRTILGRSAPPERPPDPPRAPWRRTATIAVAALVILWTTNSTLLGLGATLPGPLERVQSWAAPLRSFNAYGLFRVMTRERPEIVLEGSADGEEWKPYAFRYKPVELERSPVFAGLHMPRLDWQMWFAALEYDRDYRSSWYPRFLARVLGGSAPVLGLLRENPFPDAPPRFLRSTVWLYEFSSSAQRREGIWWRRRDPRPFFPTVTLEDGELRAVR